MNTEKFWQEFSNEAERLAQLFHSNNALVVFSTVDAMLGRYGIEHCFDITADSLQCYLIFSPEGNTFAAEEIDEILLRAPSISDWTILGRRQQKSLHDVRAIVNHLYSLDIYQCRFLWSSKDFPSQIEIFTPLETSLAFEEEQGFAYTLLSHAIGEDQLMKRRMHSVVHIGVPDDKPTLSAHEFVDAFRDWDQRG